MRNDITLIINSCDKFSDLWDSHIALLERNWGDRDMRTLLLSDVSTSRRFNHVEVVCAGEGAEITQRLRYALPKVETPFIFMTLDDYFLTERINNKQISNLLGEVERLGLDYLRLFRRPRPASPYEEAKRLYNVDLSLNYAVNLYPGIWRKSFLENTLQGSLNAWEYEVSLTETARRSGAVCACTYGEEFPFLDVIRKGKVLHKAARVLRPLGMYPEGRELCPYSHEMKIAMRTWMKEVLPRPMANAVKAFAQFFGVKFYSKGI